MTGILVGVIATDLARYTLNTSCLVQLQSPPESDVSVKFAIGGDHATNRNNIVKEAQALSKEYVLFLDDDMVFPPDLLIRLLKHEKPIVASLYVSRHYPFRAMAFNEKTLTEDGRENWNPISLKDASAAGLAEVAAAGTAGMLIHTSVFKALEYGTWFDRQDGGEDISFCNRATTAGFPIFLDLEARIGHIGIHVLWPEYDEGWTTGITVGTATIHVENADELQ